MASRAIEIGPEIARDVCSKRIWAHSAIEHMEIKRSWQIHACVELHHRKVCNFSGNWSSSFASRAVDYGL
jgi:hypothetical protein